MEKIITETDIIEQSGIPIATEDSLMSLEKIQGRESPDLWPEESITRFITQNLTSIDVPTWSMDLTTDDKQEALRLGQLSKEEIALEVKKLLDSAYHLGVDEAKEMTRGKYLSIFKQS
ncbi:protein lin-52 homolog [Nasonia vitripennis]|uniref:Uncharacterized protein n=1 Tax=Nasonia vitripennis TaxID=7425 RepID=A0A7M7GIQ1_NASVI|nr:protein lin-52 homolog [Nasonia vitripennis]XP_032455064.1 protein lin-52 homolog [Nasonia vitripennis]